MPATYTAQQLVRIRNARDVIDAATGNEHDATPAVEQFADARYAVVIERDDDGWVLPADDATHAAHHVLATYTATEGYDEWVDRIVDLSTGDVVTFDLTVSIAGTIAGERVEASE